MVSVGNHFFVFVYQVRMSNAATIACRVGHRCKNPPDWANCRNKLEMSLRVKSLMAVGDGAAVVAAVLVWEIPGVMIFKIVIFFRKFWFFFENLDFFSKILIFFRKSWFFFNFLLSFFNFRFFVNFFENFDYFLHTKIFCQFLTFFVQVLSFLTFYFLIFFSTFDFFGKLNFCSIFYTFGEIFIAILNFLRELFLNFWRFFFRFQPFWQKFYF